LSRGRETLGEAVMLRTWTPKYLATAVNDRRRLSSILTQLVLVVAMASLSAIGVKSSLAAPSGVITSFCSLSSTTISDSAAPPTKASTYPSTATVSGVVGTVTHMTITLQNLSHTFPDDIDI